MRLVAIPGIACTPSLYRPWLPPIPPTSAATGLPTRGGESGHPEEEHHNGNDPQRVDRETPPAEEQYQKQDGKNQTHGLYPFPVERPLKSARFCPTAEQE